MNLSDGGGQMTDQTRTGGAFPNHEIPSMFSDVRRMMRQSRSGDMPASNNLDYAEEVIGFSFDDGSDGRVNEAMAGMIVHDEVLRSRNMTLGEELAREVISRDRTLKSQIDIMRADEVFPPRPFKMHELFKAAKPTIARRGVGALAVVAFRHRLPLAAAMVKKGGFTTLTADMSGVGQFDPHAKHVYLRGADAWANRERRIILASAVAGII